MKLILLEASFSLLTTLLLNLPLLQPVSSSDQLRPCALMELGTCKPADTGTSSASGRSLSWNGCSSKKLGCWKESWNLNFLKRPIHETVMYDYCQVILEATAEVIRQYIEASTRDTNTNYHEYIH